MNMSNEATKTTIRFRNFNEKGWPFMSVEDAKAKRWASKADGSPTKIYLHALAKAQAKKRGEEIPVRKRAAAPDQEFAGIASPFDLRRRSGYKMIWMVLAESPDEYVPHDVLQEEVNNRLAVDPTDKNGWYEENFASKNTQYDTYKNSIVLGRAPYNGIIDVKTGETKPRSIEGLNQRIVLDPELGVKLMTNVTEPRELKKRGRKPKATDQIVEDNDTSTTIEAEATAEVVQA
jgi:hypothetical protein